MSTIDPVSLVPGVDLEGYTDEVSVMAGGTLNVMLSSRAVSADVEVVRLRHGDPNPAGPGVREEPLDWGGPASVLLTEQLLEVGSFVEIPGDLRLTRAGDFSISLWVRPTLLNRVWQSLAARWAPSALTFGLFYGGHHTLAAAVSHDGETASWITGRHYLWPNIWQLVVLAYAADRGELRLHVQLQGEERPSVARRSIGSGSLHRSLKPLLFGALFDADAGQHFAHFNGKLGSVAIYSAALGEDEVTALASGASAADVAPVIASWDLARDVGGSRVVCVEDRTFDGRAVNCPTRAVTGPRWSGVGGTQFSDDRASYDAIHLHDDDIDDAGWQPTLTLAVPTSARSGIYAVRCRAGRDSVTLPFVVRAAKPSAAICFLIPTYTWQAYGSNRARHSYTEDGLIDRGLCLYDVHSDGSMVRHCTRRRPSRSGNPSAGLQWGAHCVTANLYLIDWLETKRFSYDAITDEDLHAGGCPALEPYRCLILGSHPEYWTAEMLDGLEAYLKLGGRVLYLGGNGLYWVTSVDPQRPHLIEVRKSGDGDFEDNWSIPVPGELQHATTLEIGGLWSRRGRPPRSLLGVEMAATSDFGDSADPVGYERLASSWDPRYTFVFDGVQADVIGDFGLNLNTAAGYETDTVQEWRWGVGQTVHLARATSRSFVAQRRMPGSTGADLALTVWPNGAAVFSAASVTWTGSLSHDGYANDVSRITENVLSRFLDVPAGAAVA